MQSDPKPATHAGNRLSRFRGLARLAASTVVMLLVSGLAGCVIADTTLTLKRNGTGTLGVQYSVDEDALVKLKGILAVRNSFARATDPDYAPTPVDTWVDLLANPTESDLKAGLTHPCRKAGISLDTIRVSSGQGRRRTQIVLGFTNITDLAKLDIFPYLGLSLKRDKSGNYLLRRSGRATAAETRALMQDPIYVNQIQPALGGLKFTIDFKSPSTILATSGKKADALSTEWMFEYDKDPNALLTLQNSELTATFDGKGLKFPELR